MRQDIVPFLFDELENLNIFGEVSPNFPRSPDECENKPIATIGTKAAKTGGTAEEFYTQWDVEIHLFSTSALGTVPQEVEDTLTRAGFKTIENANDNRPDVYHQVLTLTGVVDNMNKIIYHSVGGNN